MNVLTEAANWIWLQQRVNVIDLSTHLQINRASVQRVLNKLLEQNIVQLNTDGSWLATALPTHFFQKKGRSLYKTLTLYARPKVGAAVVGVIEPLQLFLTHSQTGKWWLACNQQGRIGYIHVDHLKLIRLD